MTLLSNRLTTYLDEHAVDYQIIHHRRDYSAQRAAADTHTPGREFAKTVLIRLDQETVMLVLPAHRRVDMKKVGSALGSERLTLLTEQECRDLFPDCELGAEPPFGNLYHVRVYVALELTKDQFITFNAGSHEEAIRLSYADYAALAKPQVMDMTVSS